MPNVGPNIYDVSISGFTRSSIYIYDISSLRVNIIRPRAQQPFRSYQEILLVSGTARFTALRFTRNQSESNHILRSHIQLGIRSDIWPSISQLNVISSTSGTLVCLKHLVLRHAVTNIPIFLNVVISNQKEYNL